MRYGPWRQAEIAPSKGEKRPGHLGHKPGDVSGIGIRRRAVKVVRMYEALCESGWKFRFKAEAVSPRGFKYEAEGDTAEEAFLKAFGTWRNELYAVPPKVPVVAQPPVLEPKPVQRKVDLLSEWLKPERPYQRRLKPPPSDPKVAQKRIYNRLYLRAYRDRQRLAKAEVLVAA